MSFPTNYQLNLHQVGQTVTWCIILNVSIFCAALRYDKVAALAHSIFGWMILILTYFFILYLLGPFGFNLNDQNYPERYAHGILGCMLLGFVALQVAGGVAARLFQQGKNTDIFILKLMKSIHRYFGYFLALLFKINIIWSWFYAGVYYSWQVSVALIIWQFLCFCGLLRIKFFMDDLQTKITDPQTELFICTQIDRISDITKITSNYVIFANYVYDARELEQIHPGGHKVIQLVKGREVDRFLYGMYSAELYPELRAYNHSGFSLQLIGNPIAKIVTPPTFSGLRHDIQKGEIKYWNCIANKTKIYSLGIIFPQPIKFQGYSDLRQIGQYYSLTIINKITRLYTAVNFMTASNIALMDQLLKLQRDSRLKRVTGAVRKGKRQTELPKIKTQNEDPLKERLRPQEQRTQSRQQQSQSPLQPLEEYIPIMMKVYHGGKLTSGLQSVDFVNTPVKLSIPRGKGLELETTEPGRIIVVAGGTGLFPFSDLIDLLFKSKTIEDEHQKSEEILKRDPILNSKPFSKFSFLFLIAINEPEDIHPITLDQLIRLSVNDTKIKVVFRIANNPKQLQGRAGKCEFTRDYFNKRILTEAASEKLSRVWICGPPKLNTDTANILLENGYSKEQFLLV